MLHARDLHCACCDIRGDGNGEISITRSLDVEVLDFMRHLVEEDCDALIVLRLDNGTPGTLRGGVCEAAVWDCEPPEIIDADVISHVDARVSNNGDRERQRQRGLPSIDPLDIGHWCPYRWTVTVIGATRHTRDRST